jgi:beta-phosphoglucomutase-like phosphatase (HAD superfamily)
VQAVIFDFDGVIIDSEYEMAVCVIEGLAARGFSLTFEDIGHLFGSTENDHLWEAMLSERTSGSVTTDILVTDLMQVLPPRIDCLGLLPGVVEILTAAERRGLVTALATGQDPKRLEEHLGRLGLNDRFDVVVTSSEVARGKPAPDIFLETARRLGVAPASCVVLEDSPAGCEAAIAAGMVAVACPSRATAHCTFPTSAQRVACLLDLLTHDWLS